MTKAPQATHLRGFCVPDLKPASHDRTHVHVALPAQYGVAHPVPGTQAPDTLIGGPMHQPPADPKKKNMGLLVGGMVAIGIAIAILLGLMLSGVFGGCPSAPH